MSPELNAGLVASSTNLCRISFRCYISHGFTHLPNCNILYVFVRRPLTNLCILLLNANLCIVMKFAFIPFNPCSSKWNEGVVDFYWAHIFETAKNHANQVVVRRHNNNKDNNDNNDNFINVSNASSWGGNSRLLIVDT